MFGLSKRERAAYDKLVAALADEVDWLRAQLQMVPPRVAAGGLIAGGDASEQEAALEALFTRQTQGRMHLDEDEEAILEEVRLGALDISDAEAALAQIGALNREIDFA